MKEILNRLYQWHSLSEVEAYDILTEISKGTYNNSEIASFLTVYNMRTIKVEELAGFRKALIDLCLKVDFDGLETVDLCGTGGDGKNTFNISTLASFIVAGAGYKVAKHGNYGVSSVSGSSNVLEYLGYKFSNNQDVLKKQIEDSNICFMHAPLFHPALKGVGSIRRELGVKTFFNILGPLVNPSQPRQQLVGVFNLQLASLYNSLYLNLNKNYTIVHALDGYDEVSLTGDVKVINSKGSQIFSPTHFGLSQLNASDIFGGDTVEKAGRIFLEILELNGTKQQMEVVIANAALAIQCFKPNTSIFDCIEEAKESLVSKRALNSLKALIKN